MLDGGEHRLNSIKPGMSTTLRNYLDSGAKRPKTLVSRRLERLIAEVCDEEGTRCAQDSSSSHHRWTKNAMSSGSLKRADGAERAVGVDRTAEVRAAVGKHAERTPFDAR